MTCVDRLAQIRREIHALRIEARSIRQRLVAGTESLIGDRYVAQVRQHVTLRPVQQTAVRPGNGADMSFLRTLEAHGEY